MTSKVAVITGSSGGIGRALVNTFLDDNFFVFGIDLNPKGKIHDRFEEVVADLFQFAKNEDYRDVVMGKIINLLPDHLTDFILINNAAVQVLEPVSAIAWKAWDETLAVNTVAPFFLAQGFLIQLSATRGHIVNVSSIHSKLTKPRFSCYAASKAALEALTRSLALELSPRGISVNAIAPAAVATEMLKDGFRENPQKFETLQAFHPSGSIGSPEGLSRFVKSITEQKHGFLSGAVIDFTGAISSCLHDPG